MNCQLISSSPLAIAANDIVHEEQLAQINQNLSDRHWLAAQGVPVQLDATGISFEIDDHVVPTLGRIRASIGADLLNGNAHASSIRIREYREGNAHGAHGDFFEVDQQFLLFTALLYLRAPECGGHTRFIRGSLGSVPPIAGSMLGWFNYTDNGEEDIFAEHESIRVEQGVKRVAVMLFYGEKKNLPMARQSVVTIAQINREAQ